MSKHVKTYVGCPTSESLSWFMPRISIGLMDVDGIMVDILTIVDGVHKPTYESYD